MENASKALVMAGGVLVGILILSLAVYLFIDFGTTSAQINEQNAQQQIVEFNSKFTSYQGYRDNSGKWQITIYDIITLAGYANENNKYYGGIDDEQIEVNIQGECKNIEKKNNQEIQKLIQDYTENNTIKKFEYLGVELNSRGKVRKIDFRKLN